MGVYRDSFKLLDSAKTTVKNLNSQINKALNVSLPNRILSRSNIFNTSINVARDLTTMTLLHLEDSLVENNILIAQKETSVRGLSTLAGHMATRAISSSGVVKVNLKRNISSVAGYSVIFNKTTLKSKENGLTYVLNDGIKKVYVGNNDVIYLKIIEGEYVNSEYIAEGGDLEKIELEDKLAIENGNISVKVNGIPYKEATGLYDMPKNSKTFFTKNGIGNQVDIIFGDEVYGKPLNNGDVVEYEYLLTNGEDGNVDSESGFEFSENVYGSDGSPISINDFCDIEIESGFQLGSNGENIETTRYLSGMSSKNYVFVRPENIKSYLSKLSILSYVDVWTEVDDLIFKILLLPNLKNKLKSYSEYFDLGVSDMVLSDLQQDAILDYLNTSESQVTSTEYDFVEPKFEKYSIFIYLNGYFPDKKHTKINIKEAVAEHMLEETFLSDVSFRDYNISIGSIINKILKGVDNVEEVNINLISQENEKAKINGFYYEEKTDSLQGGETEKINFDPENDEPPNLGFNELGSIETLKKNSIPILGKDFMKYNNGGSFTIDKPIYIFHKNPDGNYEEL